MRIIILLMSVMTALSWAQTDIIVDIGKTKAANCGLCHGFDGQVSQPDYPNLVGQNFEYLVASSQAYQDGSRTGEAAKLMAVMVRQLNEQDIIDIAKFYAELKVKQ